MTHGRRLGWHHSDTAVIVPLAAPGQLFASTRGPAWQLLERYSGDEIATVPPLVLGLDNLDRLPGEAALQRLAQLRVGIAFLTRHLTRGALPDVVERVFINAEQRFSRRKRHWRRQSPSRQAIATGVADMSLPESVAKARLLGATGHVFGTPKPID